MLAVDHVAGVLLIRILWTSLQAAILVGLVSLLIRLVPRMPAASRCALWWLIGLQVLFGLCWQASVSVPAMMTQRQLQVAPLVDSRVPNDAVGVAFSAPISPSPLRSTATNQASFVSEASQAFADHWRIWLASLWLLALAAQVPILAVQRWRLLTLSRHAKRPMDGVLQTTCNRVARQLELRRCPRVLVSRKITSPLITGIWHPLILWPAEHSLTDDETKFALAHELAHLKRGDLWFGMVLALAQWLFFFHPLVRLAVREYALCREAACDARVLDFGSAPREYGRMLLSMGVAQSLRCGLGGASSTFANLKRRLLMLSEQPSRATRLCGGLFVAIVFAAALPYRAVVASQPSVAAETSTTFGVTNRAAAHPDSPAASSAARGGMPALPRFPKTEFSASHVHVDVDSRALVGIALFDGNLVVVEGENADMATAKRLYKQSRGPTLWFRQEQTAYLSHSPATVNRAKAIYAPVIAMRQKAAILDGEKWQLKGPLDGLQSRRRDVDERIRELQADPSSPAVTERLVSLNEQKRSIDFQMADLSRRLAAMKPRLDVMWRQLHQVTARADEQVARLVEEAAKSGNAQKARA